jgi:heat shock protein HslJ
MNVSSRILGMALPVMLMLGACVAPSSLSSINFAIQIEPETGGPVPVEYIGLPDGTVCHFAGMGDGLAFDETLPAYTCTEPLAGEVGLLGELQPGEGGAWSVEKVTFTQGNDSPVLLDSEVVSVLVAGLELEDGTECLHTGGGATLAFDEKRLNYICRSEGDEIRGLLGEPTAVSALEWEAELATVGRSESEGGYTLEASTTATVRPVRIVVEGGPQCLFVGDAATLTIDGKPLRYLCENARDHRLALIGGIVDAGASNWRVDKVRITAGTSGYTLADRKSVEFRLASISLTDGTICSFAGEGATLAFDGKRVNFTCGAAGESGENMVVVLGDPQPSEGGVWLAEKAILERADGSFTLASSEMLPVIAVHGTDASGNAVLAFQAALPAPVGVWQWEESVTANNSLVTPRDSTLYTIQFTPEGTLYIRADCNSGRASYEIADGALSLGPIALTRASCAPGSLAEPFVGQLANAVSLQVAESELRLGLHDGGTMTFVAQP